MRIIGGLAVSFSLLIGGCGSQADGPSSPPVDLEVGVGFDDTGWRAFVTNRGSEAIQIDQVIANGLEGDSDCDQKIFESLAAGAEREVPFPRCGRIRSVTVVVAGEKMEHPLDKPSDAVFVGRQSQYGAWYVTIHNKSDQAIRLDRVVVNGRAGDAACDVKIFENIAADSRYVQDVSGCGRPLSVAATTSVGEVAVELEPSAPAADAAAAAPAAEAAPAAY